MNIVLKSLFINSELCPADEAVDVVLSLKSIFQIEAWVLIIGREDVRRSLLKNTELLTKLLGDRNVHLPNEFYKFCSSIPSLKDNLYLNARMLAISSPLAHHSV